MGDDGRINNSPNSYLLSIPILCKYLLNYCAVFNGLFDPHSEELHLKCQCDLTTLQIPLVSNITLCNNIMPEHEPRNAVKQTHKLQLATYCLKDAEVS